MLSIASLFVALAGYNGVAKGAVTLSQTLGISYCQAFDYDPWSVYLKDHANREGEPCDAICKQLSSVAAFNMVWVRGPKEYNLFPYLLILYPS